MGDMGDMGDIFKEHREYSKSKRAFNRKQSPLALCENHIQYTSHNNGAHLRIFQVGSAEIPAVDFWPGTGKWIDSAGKKSGRGVMSLIKYLKKEYNQ